MQDTETWCWIVKAARRYRPEVSVNVAVYLDEADAQSAMDEYRHLSARIGDDATVYSMGRLELIA